MIGENTQEENFIIYITDRSTEFQLDTHYIKGLFSHLSKILTYPSEVNEVPIVVSLILVPETREKKEAGQLKVLFNCSKQKVMRKWRAPSWGSVETQRQDPPLKELRFSF